ncbi:MAG TPA: N-acetylneuraminate synthase family protein [Coxiellaceae bacterium]|nr:N-acetylneuraminate synthase family protein [Coxiellaceae bacterium]
MNSIFVSDKIIGESQRTFLIAEVAQAHDGSLGMAHAFIDAADKAGADAIKFQTHLADQESTLDEMFRIPFSYEDKNRYDYWKRMEFTESQWIGLAKHAREKGLIFLSTPFSVAAVDLLTRLEMPLWKIGSGEINTFSILHAVLNTKKPILLSTGMSDYEEISKTVEQIKLQKVPLVIMQCTSQYPTPLTRVGLNVLHEFRERFHCGVGLSDHSGALYAPLAAMAQGAHVIEVHVAFSRDMFGPDTPASLTFEEFAFLAQARDAFHVLQTHPVSKDLLAEELKKTKQLFAKSYAPITALIEGTVLTESLLVLKKPGTGFTPIDLDKLVGRRLKRAVSPARLLVEEDLE